MRTVSNESSVRLYFLDDATATARTLFYGTLDEALAIARQEPPAIRSGLWLATESDVVGYDDFETG